MRSSQEQGCGQPAFDPEANATQYEQAEHTTQTEEQEEQEDATWALSKAISGANRCRDCVILPKPTLH
eukprot:7377188-Prymnesium_polylepis.2